MDYTYNPRTAKVMFLLFFAVIVALAGEKIYQDYKTHKDNKLNKIQELEFNIECLETDKIFNMKSAEIVEQEVSKYKQNIKELQSWGLLN